MAPRKDDMRSVMKFLRDVAEWLRRSVSNHARSTRVGSNPVVITLTTSQQSIQLSILPRLVNEYSEVTLREKALDTLITANLKLKCFIQYQDSSQTTLREQALDTY